MWKKANELRISDWSSDVCSSDLIGRHILDAQFEKIVDVAGHAVEFDDLGNVADRRIERVEPCFAMLGGTQAHENGEIEAERARIQDRDAPRDRKSTRLNSSH